MWDDITYPFPNSNGCPIAVWERISDFIPHFIVHVITLLVTGDTSLFWGHKFEIGVGLIHFYSFYKMHSDWLTGKWGSSHSNDVIMSMMASQITSRVIVYSTVYSSPDERKHQSASMAFVRGSHRCPVNSAHKRPVTQKMFPFDDVVMCTLSQIWLDVFESIIDLMLAHVKNPMSFLTCNLPKVLNWVIRYNLKHRFIEIYMRHYVIASNTKSACLGYTKWFIIV